MLSVGNAGIFRQARWMVWLSILLLVVAAFFTYWKKIEKEALYTAMDVARQRISERASFYRQEWLLHGQPINLLVEGEEIAYSPKGWVLPLDSQGNLDCQLWLEQLYPDNKLLGLSLREISSTSVVDHFQCDYNYGDGARIKLTLINNNFSITVGFKAE